MMSLLTFGVSALLGNPLTAASTFASVALLNMLIGPLNTFPWVLNGLVEAWISLKRVQQLIDVSDIFFLNGIIIKHFLLLFSCRIWISARITLILFRNLQSTDEPRNRL